MSKQHKIFCLCLLLLVLTGIQFPVEAQPSIRTASPPIVKIVLGKPEGKPPSGLPDEFTFIGRGGGPSIRNLQPPQNAPYWHNLPDPLVHLQDDYDYMLAGTLTACGYRSTEPPTGTLIFPSGHKGTLEGRNYPPTHCWEYLVSWEYGMELGLYTLMLDHPDGKLTYTWGVDYPHCPMVTTTDLWHENRKIWVTGYLPGAVLTAHFYALGAKMPDGYSAYYVATRKIIVEHENTAIMIETQPDSGYFAYEVSYTIADANGQVVHFTTQWPLLKSPQHPTPTSIPAKYKTYKTTQDDPEKCGLRYFRFAQTHTKQGKSIPLYSAFDNTTKIANEIENGIPVEVIEERPALQNGRVTAWHRVRTEDGRDGWTYGSDTLIGVETNLIPNGQARVLFNEVFNKATERLESYKVYLYKLPSKSSATIAQILPNTHLVVLETKNNEWYKVRTDDQQVGWVNLFVENDFGLTLEGLPWATIPITDK